MKIAQHEVEVAAAQALLTAVQAFCAFDLKGPSRCCGQSIANQPRLLRIVLEQRSLIGLSSLSTSTEISVRICHERFQRVS